MATFNMARHFVQHSRCVSYALYDDAPHLCTTVWHENVADSNFCGFCSDSLRGNPFPEQSVRLGQVNGK